MRDLAILFLVSPILYRISQWLFPIILCMSLYTGYADLFDHSYSMKYVCFLYSIGFFSMGCFLRRLSKETQQKLLRYYSVPLIAVYFGLALAKTILSFCGMKSLLPELECNIPFITTTVSLWILYQLARFLEEKVPFVVPLALKFAPVTFLTFAAHAIIYLYLLPQSIICSNWMILVPIAVSVVLALFFQFLKSYCKPLLHLVAHYKLRPDDLVQPKKES